MKIKILISPTNLEEVDVTIDAMPDIVDIKNPKEGSLGANFPWIINSARKKLDSFLKMKGFSESTDETMELSAAIGDFPNLPGSASLAALGAAVSGADYIKIGIMGPKSKEEAIYFVRQVVKSVKDYDPTKKVVVAGYADQKKINKSIDPLLIPEITAEADADIAMLDTAIKDGSSLFQHLTHNELKEFCLAAKQFHLKSALAGSLCFEDISSLKEIQPDIIGVRSMVCENFDRNKGKIDGNLIGKLKLLLI